MRAWTGTATLLADAGLGAVVILTFVCAGIVPVLTAAALLPAIGVPGRQGRQWLVLSGASSIGVIWAMIHYSRTGSLPWSYMGDAVGTFFGLALPALVTGFIGLPLGRWAGRLPPVKDETLVKGRAVEQRDEADEARER